MYHDKISVRVFRSAYSIFAVNGVIIIYVLTVYYTGMDTEFLNEWGNILKLSPHLKKKLDMMN